MNFNIIRVITRYNKKPTDNIENNSIVLNALFIIILVRLKSGTKSMYVRYKILENSYLFKTKRFNFFE
jgi:hypothetical protein